MEALEKGTIYTAVIDGYSSDGLGIARVNGAVVFVPHAVRGEEIWDIAKAYGATTAQILQANELEEETLPAGRMLLIPNAR